MSKDKVEHDDCNVCYETYNKSNHLLVECEQVDCKYKACIECVRTYLLSSANEPHCMKCNVNWTAKFLLILKKNWLQDVYRRHREKLLCDIELSKVAESMHDAERYMAGKKQDKVTHELQTKWNLAKVELDKINKGFEMVKKNKISPNQLVKNGIMINHDGKKRSAFQLLSFKNISFEDIKNIWPEIKNIDKETEEQITIESQYSGYLDRQREDINDFKKEEGLLLPKNLDYKSIGSLSNEIVEKLSMAQPPTLGAASRISGITPAAIIALLRFVKKQKNYKAA